MRVETGKGLMVGLGLFLAASSCLAAEKTVTVPGRAMPWDSGVNRKLAFGKGDGRLPVTVFGLSLNANKTLRITATGSTTTAAGGASFGPQGQIDYVTDAGRGNSGTAFPSRYIDPATYPVHLNELVGAFVDADGTVIGQPFRIGEAAEVEVPKGALALSLGVNDDIYADNSGSLQVTITYRVPTVTGEELKE